MKDYGIAETEKAGLRMSSMTEAGRPIPAPIYALPVELITRIFQLGSVPDSPTQFLLAPETEYTTPPSSHVPVLVSHVCSHWRRIALATPALWTSLHFSAYPHLARARAFLNRCRAPHHLLTVLVDTVAFADHVPGRTLCRTEFNPVFDIIIPHINRWRAFHLKVRDNTCKAYARQRLGTGCPPAPNLRTLQLYHFEDFADVESLYLATYRPPVKVFSNSLPALRHLSLIGVNLPWEDTAFLAGLHSIELALHADSIRPTFPQWARMLSDSPCLRSLSLHYSGPRVPPVGPATPPADPWPLAPPIPLPYLTDLALTDLDPPYLCALLARLHLPALRSLSLDLGELDQDDPSADFAPLIDLLCPPPPASPNATPPPCPLPNIARLASLRVRALECAVPAWRRLVHALLSLDALEVDFARVHAGAQTDAFWAVLMDVRGPGSAQKSGNEKIAEGVCGVIEDRCPAKIGAVLLPVLPRLRTLRVAGVSADAVRLFSVWRVGVGAPVDVELFEGQGDGPEEQDDEEGDEEDGEDGSGDEQL